jgi:DNA (cytosine-5)-methyltransferase 1
VTNRLRVVDLFAGSGALSIGLAQAGFRIATAVESDPQAAATYSAAHPETILINRDIRHLSAKEIRGRLRGQVDLLAAGPPCQGFSIKGQRRSDHPGNAMLAEVIRVTGQLRPRALLVENVVGLTSLSGGWYFDRLVTGIERIATECGGQYDVDYRVLNAVDYGSPQQRRRLFIVAVEPGLQWKWPDETSELGDLTVWDAIGDLPTDSCIVGVGIPYPPAIELSHYAAALRSQGLVLNHHTKRLEETRQRRLAALEQGQDRRSLPAELATGGHETKYRRLRADAPSPTLTAHMGKDLSDFIHPFQQRTLTVREAARIQGFPDDIEFIGSQASQFRQIGNAVPVPLARALGQAFVTTLRGGRRSKRKPSEAIRPNLTAMPSTSERRASSVPDDVTITA